MNERLSTALAGRYRIEGELGTGGMATVYLAEDLRHQRRVALKVLREDLAASVGAARFSREIAIAAQLQHPNILPMHESGEAGGFLYFVMPYVEGPSLRQRLTRDGQLPVTDGVRLLVEIVDALACAHAQGIVHRDMKPDNIMLSGRHALVTDFGVAKALTDAAGSGSVTTAGIALGTPAYMAPEQAMADPQVDHRADIYAVGVIAYELLAGRLPFSGSAQQVLAAHITATPDPLGLHRAGLSPVLEHVVMKCLAKQPGERWQSAQELLEQLEPLITPSGGTLPAGAARRATRRAPRRAVLIVGAALVVVALIATVLWPRGDPVSAMGLGRALQFTSEPGLEVYPAISPNGKVVAYAAGTSARMRIYLRPVESGRTLTLTEDSTSVETQPAWSADGARLLFLSRGGAYVASSLGGAVRELIGPGASPVTAATWSPSGQEFAAVRDDSLFVISTDGAQRRFVVRGRELHSCDWSPAGTWIACVSGNYTYARPGAFFSNQSPSRIVLISAGGRIVPVTDSTTSHQNPQWSSDGSRLFFASNRDGPSDIYAMAVRSDGRSRGPVERITTGLGVHSFSLDAASSRLAYAVYQERANIWSLPVPRTGLVSTDGPVQVTSGSQLIEVMRVGANGRWVYYDSNLNGNADIYRVPAGGGEPQRLTTASTDEYAAVGSPDDSEFAYHSFRTGSRDIFVQKIGAADAEQLTNTAAQECCPVWSPDGSRLAFSEFGAVGNLWLTRRDASGRWSQPVQRLPRGFLHVWSPDGSTIAVATGRTIRGSIQVERLELVSPDTGPPTTLYAVTDTLNDPIVEDPHWAPDGKGLYFKSHDPTGQASLWYISVSGDRPRLLARFDDPSRPSFRPNMSTDGRRFYFTINDRQSDVWVAEVVRR